VFHTFAASVALRAAGVSRREIVMLEAMLRGFIDRVDAEGCVRYTVNPGSPRSVQLANAIAACRELHVVRWNAKLDRVVVGPTAPPHYAVVPTQVLTVRARCA
jgi:hypothetical protein